MKYENTPLDIFESIGNKLYYLRHTKKEKITSVAKSVGISHAVISKIENGRYLSLSVELLAKLATYYNIPFEELFINQTHPGGKIQDQNAIFIELLMAENKKLKQSNV